MLHRFNRISISVLLKLGLVSLVIVAIFGLLMRLKILMPMPWLQQKFILHAHSHFAFSGWVSHMLMVLLFAALSKKTAEDSLTGNRGLLVLSNYIVSWVMLIAFSVQGYALISIIASTLSLIISYFFALQCWRDTKTAHISKITRNWIRAALIFLVLSSFGTLYLVYLRVTHDPNAYKQIGAIYYYLHFQYNGWFLFACMGIFMSAKQVIIAKMRNMSAVFWVFTICAAWSVFLSLLWVGMPVWLEQFLGVVVILQLVAWVYYLCEWNRCKALENRKEAKTVLNWVWWFIVIAISFKLIFQALSAIPSLSQLVFGLRPVVIAYLHLVLLAVVSMFIIGFIFSRGLLLLGVYTRMFILFMAIGIILNELALGLQAASGLLLVMIPGLNWVLAIAAGIMVMAMLGVLLSLRRDMKR